MYSVKYGTQEIVYHVKVADNLKRHYISVGRDIGVLLKGPRVTKEKADALILQKARWIISKVKLVEESEEERANALPLVTGSRMFYLGRSYYVSIEENNILPEIHIEFTHSKFRVFVPRSLRSEQNIRMAFELFYRKKAKEKILPRVQKWVDQTGLSISGVSFRKLTKRWGSCTDKNEIILNPDAILLPYRLIDYLIVHELVHTEIKDHSKAFWSSVAQWLPDYNELDKQISEMPL